MLALLTLFACATTVCDDLCLVDTVMAAETTEEVAAAAAGFQDSTHRDGAVIRWIELHRGELVGQSAEPLCNLLTPREGETCLRRISSAHLSR